MHILFYEMAVYEDITEEMAQDLLDRASIEDAVKRETLISQLRQLKGPIPVDFVSQYLVTYRQRLLNVNDSYAQRIQQIDDDIKDLRIYYTEDLGQKYSPKQESEDRDELVTQAKQWADRRLLVADTYKNDLENYAYALLEEWKKRGSSGPLVVGHKATRAIPSSKAMYYQLVRNEHDFEPAEPLPFLAAMVGVPLALLFGMGAGYSYYSEWHKKTITRLEKQVETLVTTDSFLKRILDGVSDFRKRIPSIVELFQSNIEAINDSIDFWKNKVDRESHISEQTSELLVAHISKQQRKRGELLAAHISNQQRKRGELLAIIEELQNLKLQNDAELYSSVQSLRSKIKNMSRSRIRELKRVRTVTHTGRLRQRT